MSERIDHVRVRQVILDAIGPHGCIHEAREAGVYLMPARDLAIELAMPMGPKIAQQYANKMPRNTRVEIADLEQASRQGVLEGVDRYEPRKLYKGRPIQADTYLYLWIRKRVLEEIACTHWSITRPPRKEMERYMKGEMTDEEVHHYTKFVLRGVVDTDLRERAEWRETKEHFAERDRDAMHESGRRYS